MRLKTGADPNRAELVITATVFSKQLGYLTILAVLHNGRGSEEYSVNFQNVNWRHSLGNI
jgi:hypothetical protein